MASIRKRGSKWQAQVRRLGHAAISKSFMMKADAIAWAREQERSIDRGELQIGDTSSLKATRLGDLLTRYEETVTSTKRGAASEIYRLRTLRSRLGDLTLNRLTPAAIAHYRDQRLSKPSGSLGRAVSSGSVRRELAILAHCLELARAEWGYPLGENPVRQIVMPEASKSRSRRLGPDEAVRLFSALEASRLPYLKPIVLLAIETGMRRGEILSLRWECIHLHQSTAHLPMTKNGHARTVPLSPRAVSIIDKLPRTGFELFEGVSSNALRLSWERLKERSGLSDLRLHDLRHEAVSRFFELGLSTPEVALISGHRDYRMLARYTHLRPEAVALKLAKLKVFDP
jgi:integrase